MFLSMSDRRWVINKESGEFLLQTRVFQFIPESLMYGCHLLCVACVIMSCYE